MGYQRVVIVNCSAEEHLREQVSSLSSRLVERGRTVHTLLGAIPWDFFRYPEANIHELHHKHAEEDMQGWSISIFELLLDKRIDCLIATDGLSLVACWDVHLLTGVDIVALVIDGIWSLHDSKLTSLISIILDHLDRIIYVAEKGKQLPELLKHNRNKVQRLSQLGLPEELATLLFDCC